MNIHRRLTGKHIAMEVCVLPATVSRVLKRAGLSRLRDIEPAQPIRRYEREHSGEMIHIDIKRLGRFSQVGHRITGDPQKGKSRGPAGSSSMSASTRLPCIAFSQILLDKKKERPHRLPQGGGRLLRQPRRFDSARHDRQRLLLQIEGFRQGLPRSRPRKAFTTKTNGKAERFIQTALREWTYAFTYPSSQQHAAELPVWLHRSIGTVTTVA
jgi:hypothetical protein